MKPDNGHSYVQGHDKDDNTITKHITFVAFNSIVWANS
jgi:hypothetical protein